VLTVNDHNGFREELMKIILALFIFSTGSIVYAQSSYIPEEAVCENGNVVNAQVSADFEKEKVEYSLEVQSQENNGFVLIKKQTSDEGVVIVKRYNLIQQGIDGDNWSFFAMSADSAEYFFVLLSFDGLKIVSIYTADRDFKACGGGMIVTQFN
jgi:hypothetical protein